VGKKFSGEQNFVARIFFPGAWLSELAKWRENQTTVKTEKLQKTLFAKQIPRRNELLGSPAILYNPAKTELPFPF